MRSVKKGVMKNRFQKILFVLFFCCAITNICRADDPDDPPDPGDDPDKVPLDGGVVTLVVAGVGYGIKKMRDAKQQKIKESNLRRLRRRLFICSGLI